MENLKPHEETVKKMKTDFDDFKNKLKLGSPQNSFQKFKEKLVDNKLVTKDILTTPAPSKPKTRAEKTSLMSSKRKKNWTKAEVEYLKANAGTVCDEDIAKSLLKSKRAIREMRYRLGLIKINGRGRVGLIGSTLIIDTGRDRDSQIKEWLAQHKQEKGLNEESIEENVDLTDED